MRLLSILNVHVPTMCTCVHASCPAGNDQPIPRYTETISVLDFGAKADGVTGEGFGENLKGWN